MKLHEAIESVLRERNEPLTFNEIARYINNQDLYFREDNKPIKGSQVRRRIGKYSDMFLNINGYVLIKEEGKWQNILGSYYELNTILRGIYNVSEQEFIITTLFFYKRLYDTNVIEISSPFYFDQNSNINNADSLGINFWFDQLILWEQSSFYDLTVFKELSALLKKYPTSNFDKFFDLLNNIQTEHFTTKEFGKIFEFLLEIYRTDSLKTILVRTPRDIIDLMVQILNPQGNSSLYDPVCGTGGLLAEAYRLNGNLSINGSEINHRVVQIAMMNQIMNGDFNFVIKRENCFNRLTDSRKFDYIIGDLPLVGLQSSDLTELSYQYNIDLPKKSKGFGAFLLFSLTKLNENGKAIFTVSDGFLFKSGSEQKVRNYLLENDLIEAVINLPNGILKPYTSGNASLIVINRNKSANQINKVKFINASESYDIEEFDGDQVLDSYLGNLNSYTQIIDIEEIISLNTLDPKYFTNNFYEIRKLLISEKAKYLGDLVTVKSGKKVSDKEDLNTEEGIPFVRIENLERDILDIRLSKNNIKDYLFPNEYYELNSIKEECILLAKIGESLKPTYFVPEINLKEIFIHTNVVAIFSKDKQDFSLEFLYYQLYSDFVQNQFDQGLNRSIVPFMTLKKIKELIIPYPDYRSQEDYIEVEKATIINAERTRVEERFKRLGYKEEAEERELDIVRTITHQLRHNLTGISLMMNKLSNISVKRNIGNIREYDNDDEILIPKEEFEAPENKSIEELILRAEKKANTLNTILLDVEKAINLDLSYSNVSLKTLLNEVKKDYKEDNFLIEISGDDINLEISKSHFIDLINTLVQNAKEHSFSLDGSNYKITFKIKIDFNRNLTTIEYTNNGSPINVTQKEFTSILTKSIDSNGSGIGGYYINKIIEAHHGSLEIIENYKKGVQMIIELPIKQPE